MWLVIINPTSRGGKAKERGKRFVDYLAANNIEHQLYYTEAQNNEEAIQGIIADFNIKHISILGGDGTINMVVNALPHLDFTLHLVPAGTGNDLAKMLYAGYTEVSAFSLISNSSGMKEIDCWRCNEHLFCNGFGAGFDGAVAHSMFSKNYWLPTILKYWIEIFRLIVSYKSTTVKVNNKPMPVFMIVAANGKVYGGGFNIAPKAEIDDETLDIINVGKIPVLKRLQYLPKIEKGKHLHLKVIDYSKAKELNIKSAKPLPAQLDGEPILASSYNIRFAGKLKFVV